MRMRMWKNGRVHGQYGAVFIRRRRCRVIRLNRPLMNNLLLTRTRNEISELIESRRSRTI